MNRTRWRAALAGEEGARLAKVLSAFELWSCTTRNGFRRAPDRTEGVRGGSRSRRRRSGIVPRLGATRRVGRGVARAARRLHSFFGSRLETRGGAGVPPTSRMPAPPQRTYGL